MGDDMMMEQAVQSKKKIRPPKKARICGKQLSKEEKAINEENRKESLAEINKKFGEQ